MEGYAGNPHGLRPRLIVGIDPGITAAYAALSLKGEVILLKSSKNMDLASMLHEIAEVGKPIVVGTDVKGMPNFVRKFAAKLNAKVIAPEEDLRVPFKVRLVEEFHIKPQDPHQRDALAAAISAFHEINPTLQKVAAALKERGKEHLCEEVSELCIRGISINDALMLLEEEHQKPSAEIVKKRKRRTVDGHISSLVERNIHLQQENALLKQQLAFQRRVLEKRDGNIHQEIDRRLKVLNENKDKTIGVLGQKVIDAETERDAAIRKLESLQLLLSEHSHAVIIKKLPHLGKNMISHIREKDVLLITDPSTFSSATLEVCKQQNNILIMNGKPPETLGAQCTVLDRSALILVEHEAFAFGDREELMRAIDAERKKKNVLFKVLAEYREERKKSDL